MNVALQRKIDRMLGRPLCRMLSWLPRRKDRAAQGPVPSRFLAVLLSEMGSLVLALPMFRRIREKYPQASIYALCFERNREFLEVLDIIPPSHIFTVQGDSLIRLFMDTLHVIIRMRQVKIDTVLDCELFSRISSIYSFLSGARLRAGFHPHTQEGLYRGDFMNRPVLYNPYHHISQQFVNLVEAVESNGVPTVKRRIENGRFEVPEIEIHEPEKEAFLRRFLGDFPQTDRKPLVLLYPSGGLVPIRAWPLESFCRVAEELIQKGHIVGIIGMMEDKAFAKRIMSHCGYEGCIDLTGYTRSVRELMILFHFASLLITNDGGPGHFASMTPMPAIILYGPETPALYGTLDEKSIELYAGLSCSPCLTAYNHRCSPCDGENACLKEISPRDVLEKAYQIVKPGENLKKRNGH